MAGVLTDQGKMDDAEEFYKKALTLEPQNADAYNNYGVFLGKTGHKTKALEKYKMALKLNPSHSVALVNMARQLRSSGNIQEAEQAYNRFVWRVRFLHEINFTVMISYFITWHKIECRISTDR